ncbi:hypothetical protein L1047_16015 [Synechococcus sp. Nb3U1]|uniref:hypothetical protein n=1 Tax=Synechococcus sp. Nb3U1 TaxID=1914529 RepID=UPI001F43FF8C|nr:hypothetical protein [Synechococcus sp. Nb3U1]MCF2972702.1 hypothetical protein [Synechococcus sp. Nb3U1]
MKHFSRIGLMMAALVGGWVSGQLLHQDDFVAAQPAFETVALPQLPVGVDQTVFNRPVARFNPDRPSELVIINRTGLPLEYGFTDPRREVFEFPPEETLRLSNYRIPNCMAINTPMLAPVGYRVSVDPTNVITVEVRLVNDVSGDHCLDLQATGAIFVN